MKKLLIFILLSGFSLTMAAQETVFENDTTGWSQHFQGRMDSLMGSPLLQTSQLGLMVYDLTADSALYTYNHRQTLRPASTMKLLTAVTGIDYLGGDYQLKTSLCYAGSIRNNTLTGNVYCVGGMDPVFDRTDMTAFVNKLRHLGIDTIRGRILADVSFKDGDRLGEGWCWDDDNPVLSPLLYDRKDNFTDVLSSELRRDGVVIIDTLVKTTRQKATFVSSRSHGIDELLTTMMKESDNLYAECLFMQLSASGGKTATGRQSASQVRRMIQKVGLKPGDYKVADGSGLSLYNYVSAELEVRLLRYAWQHRGVYALLLPSLPVAGIDGTLKSRMTSGATYRNVRAKTGTLTGISSLAGYCKAPNGHELAFCIINQGVLRIADGRSFQDAVCHVLCEP